MTEKTKLDEKDFLKIDEVCTYLGIGAEKVYRMVEEGLPRYGLVGNSVYYYKEDIKNFILERRIN